MARVIGRKEMTALADIARRLFPCCFDAFESYKMRMVRVRKEGVQ